MKEGKREDVLSLRRAYPLIFVKIPWSVEVLVATSSIQNDEPSSPISIHIADYIQIPRLVLKSVYSSFPSILT